jgi:transketolase
VSFDAAASRERCRRMRRRILDISQTVPALHIAPAFSCLEIVDTVYHGLMRRDGPTPDSFILSKGHGAMAQYAVLEQLGVLSREDLDSCGKDGGRLGMHPDIGLPGIEASTGSLGHGLPLAVGMALADRTLGPKDRTVFCVMSDGELEEGSVWEAMMLAPTLRLDRLVAIVDLNDYQSLGRISEIHPNFYPIVAKVEAFGWEVGEVDGHDSAALHAAVTTREGARPLLVLARTVKGKGVSYMENAPIWHYRSPSPDEYRQAVRELEAAS